MAASSSRGLGLFIPNPLHSPKHHRQKKKTLLLPPSRATPVTSSSDLAHLGHQLFIAVGVGLPCTVMECGDMIYRSTLPRSQGLTVTAPGVALALAAASYLWATPGVAPAFWDMFVLAFLDRMLRPAYRKDDFQLGRKLGEGAYGVVYRAALSADGKAGGSRGDLVVKKATEYGAVEIWMNERVRRACAGSCADFVYGFLESSSKGKEAGECWLVWRFEGEETLSDLLLSKEFPYNVSIIIVPSPHLTV